MISGGFFKKARIGDRVRLIGDESIVVRVDEDSVRMYMTGFGDCETAEPSCTGDGIDFVSGQMGDGWAARLLDEQVDGHAVWEFYSRGSDQEGDEG
jgi:hypothetical protein